MKFSILFILVLSIISLDLFSQNNIEDTQKPNFYDIQKKFNEYWEGKEPPRGSGYKPFRRWENFWSRRVDSNGRIPNALDAYKSYIKFKNKKERENQLLSNTNNKSWVEIGPTYVPANKLNYSSSGAGRVNVIAFHPTDENIIWAGSASGGAWYSTDKGLSWTLISFTDIMSLGVSDIAISPSDPNIIYIATGDDDGFFMEGVYSIGILKSTDGGQTWTVIGMHSNLREGLMASRILIHPNDPNYVLLATNRGAYLSTDGGVVWENKQTGFFRSMEFKPDDPNIVYASTSNGAYLYQGNSSFYKSVDGGKTWTRKFVQSDLNRIEIGVSPNNSDYVYLVTTKQYYGSLGGFYKSTNAGESFEKVINSRPNLLGYSTNGNDDRGQGHYDLAITVNPNNVKEIFVGGIHIWKSKDEGKTWECITQWQGINYPYVHADQHFLAINPLDNILYAAHDGGINYSTNSGNSWKDISDGLGIAQFYRIAVGNTAETLLTGGTQDNGSHLFKKGFWFNVTGGDGMATQINPTNHNYIYTTSQYGTLYRSQDNGQKFHAILFPSLLDSNETGAWVTPFVINPIKSSSMIIGLKNVWRSYDYGSSWRKMSNFNFSSPINFVALAPSDTNVIYIARGNSIMGTYDNGVNWQIISSFQYEVTSIAVDFDDPKRLYVTVSSYSNNYQVFEIYGRNVNNISYDLPSIPANTVTLVRKSPGLVIIGTDVGIMYKNPTSNEWQMFGKDLPPVVVTDLQVNYSTGKLYAGTYGRGIWENEVFGCKINQPIITNNGPLQFCEGDSVLFTLEGDYYKFIWSNGDTNKTIAIKHSGSFYALVTDTNGCSAMSKVIDVNVIPVPTFTVSSENNGSLCNKDSIWLTLPLGFKDYLWSTGETSRRIYVKKPGKFYATATSSNDCNVMSNVFEVIQGEIPEKPIITQIKDTLMTDTGYTYKWYLNDKVINSNSNKIVISEYGDYKVEITNSTNCSNTSDVLTTSSIKEVSNDIVSILPNPTTGIVNIRNYSLTDKSTIVVKNLHGQELYSVNIDFSKTISYNLDLSNYTNGVYFIIISNKDKTYFKKLIKNN